MQDLYVVGDEKRSKLPENFEQIGHRIDIEIAARLVRCMWRALDNGDLDLQQKLNGFLDEEIGGLRLQHEIDGDDDQLGLALASLLEQYHMPIKHIG